MTPKSRGSGLSRSPRSKRSARETKQRTLIADRINELRTDRGYSVPAFAVALQTKENTVREWLRPKGNVLPRAEGLLAIADHFGVSVDWLLGRVGAQKHPGQQRSRSELADELAVHIQRELTMDISPVIENSTDEYEWRVWGQAALTAALLAMKDAAKNEYARVATETRVLRQKDKISIAAATLEKLRARRRPSAPVQFDAADEAVAALLQVVSDLDPLRPAPSADWPVWLAPRSVLHAQAEQQG